MKSSFKIISMIIALLLVTGTSIMAKEKANKGYDGPKPEIYEGASALVFTYVPFQSNLGPVVAGWGQTKIIDNGNSYLPIGGVGYKYFFSPSFSTTFGVAFSSQTDESAPVNDRTTKETLTVIGVSVDANYQLVPLYSIAPYMGINVNFGSRSENIEQTGDGPVDETTASGTAFGVGVNLGFDWYFIEGMSLGGKYTFGLLSFSAPETKTTMGENTTTTDGTSRMIIGTGIGYVILSVHL